MWLSAPGGTRHARWADWAIAALVVWMGALPLGLAVLALGYVLSAGFGLSGSAAAAQPLAVLYAVGYMLFFSPILSWLGVLLALPPAWWMVRRGLGGWASFALLGLAAGGLAAGLIQGFAPAVGAVFGLLAALAFRAILFRLRPEMFTGC